jgi:hypothetical protein
MDAPVLEHRHSFKRLNQQMQLELKQPQWCPTRTPVQSRHVEDWRSIAGLTEGPGLVSCYVYSLTMPQFCEPTALLLVQPKRTVRA